MHKAARFISSTRGTEVTSSMSSSRAPGWINAWKNLTMPYFTDLTGLVSVASAITASLLLIPKVKRISRHWLAIMTGVFFVAMLIPFSGFSLAAYVRGITGDLSITAMVLLWCALTRPWSNCEAADTKHRLALLALIALAAVLFYPMALGLGAFDPYRLGYGNHVFVTALLMVALAAWFRKHYLAAFCTALATLAWAIGW